MSVIDPQGDIETLRTAIVIELSRGRPSMRRIAASIGVSVRTLQRRLWARGLTFSQVLGEVRQHAAQTMLTRTAMPLSTIAASLGYSELSSFTRAFRAWTGKTPSAYRTQHARER